MRILSLVKKSKLQEITYLAEDYAVPKLQAAHLNAALRSFQISPNN
jgi:hypothetical protein